MTLTQCRSVSVEVEATYANPTKREVTLLKIYTYLLIFNYILQIKTFKITLYLLIFNYILQIKTFKITFLLVGVSRNIVPSI